MGDVAQVTSAQPWEALAGPHALAQHRSLFAPPSIPPPHHCTYGFSVSDTTPTLELPTVGMPCADDPPGVPVGHTDPFDHDAAATASSPVFIDSEPTTLTMPVVSTAGLAVVVDEPEPGLRSEQSLSISARRARTALITLAAGAFVFGVNEASVVAMSPHIARGLDASVAAVGLLVTAFSATVVVATLPLTWMTQRLSKRATLAATLGVWSAGVVIAATAQSLVHLAAGRMVSAAAHALFWALVAPTAVSLFPPYLRGQTVTRVMVGSAMAGVVGTPLVPLAAANLSWRVPYMVLAGLGVVLTVVIALALPRSRPAAPRADGDADTPAEGHSRGDIPSTRAFARVLVVTFIATMAMAITWTYIVAYYTRQASVPSTAIPVMFAIGGVVAVGTTLAVGPLLTRRAVETAVVALGTLSLAWAVLAIGVRWSAVAAQVIQAAGWAALVAALLNWAMRHTPWRTDMGAATYTVVFSLGAALGPLAGAFVVDTWSTRTLPLVSLAMTVFALGVAARVDRRTVRRLHVPRRVRAALAAREHVRQRRLEWRRRVRVRVSRATVRASAARASATRETAARTSPRGHGTARARLPRRRSR